MLPQMPQLSEPRVTIQPLTVFVGLGSGEIDLLESLESQARTLAPLLGSALAKRIRQTTSAKLADQRNSIWLCLYLQDWFLQLFQQRDEQFLEIPRFFLCPSLDLILTGIDIILAYGYEITQSSPNPSEATRAFHKALALKISSEQLRSQVDETEHLYEMMLLD